jgi:uncharacterized membrane protein YtjA (UPF0391 family)
MLYWAALLFVLAVVAAALGGGVVAAAAGGAAKALLVLGRGAHRAVRPAANPSMQYRASPRAVRASSLSRPSDGG